MFKPKSFITAAAALLIPVAGLAIPSGADQTPSDTTAGPAVVAFSAVSASAAFTSFGVPSEPTGLSGALAAIDVSIVAGVRSEPVATDLGAASVPAATAEPVAVTDIVVAAPGEADYQLQGASPAGFVLPPMSTATPAVDVPATAGIEPIGPEPVPAGAGTEPLAVAPALPGPLLVTVTASDPLDGPPLITVITP